MSVDRFIKAQDKKYKTAYKEILNGKKKTHWMWFVFPQLKGLGSSEISLYYGIDGIEEAREYYGNEILKERLIKITEALLGLNESDPVKIFGVPDNYKLCSSMTLFNFVAKDTDIFGKVIDKFFAGKKDEKTLKMLEEKACMYCK